MSAILHTDWPAPRGVHALTTLRHGAGHSQPPFDGFNMGLRCGDDVAAVMANRQQLVGMMSLPSEPRWLRQVHGAGVVRFNALAPSPATAGGEEGRLQTTGLRADARTQVLPAGGTGRGGVASEYGISSQAKVKAPIAWSPARSDAIHSQTRPACTGEDAESEADASVTSARGVVLAILTADCLPVVFATEDGNEIAAAHAGWRGLAGGVLEAAVAAMGTSPAKIIAWLGPAAGPDAYEIGEEVFDAFMSRDVNSGTAFKPTRPGHWRVDLYALARMRLAGAGVTRIFGGNSCTISNPQRFYSHRRDQRTGRMATLIWRD